MITCSCSPSPDRRCSDAAGFLRAAAARQVEAGGGPPGPPPDRNRSGDDELIALLPDEAPGGLEQIGTAVGGEEVEGLAGQQAEIAEFLNRESATAVRAWSDGGDVLVGVGVTSYPYEIFAAATIAVEEDSADVRILATGEAAGAPDAVLFAGTGDREGQVGTVSRRGEYVVWVLVNPTATLSEAQSAELAVATTRSATQQLPDGSTAPYRFPDAPSRFTGLALTAGIVTAAALGSTVIARVRGTARQAAMGAGRLDARSRRRAGPPAVDGDRSRRRRRPAAAQRRSDGGRTGRRRDHRRRRPRRRLRLARCSGGSHRPRRRSALPAGGSVAS